MSSTSAGSRFFSPQAEIYGRRYAQILGREADNVSLGELQFVPEAKLPEALDKLAGASGKALIAVDTTYSEELAADGSNLHLTVNDTGWWEARLRQSFPHVEALPSFDSTAAFFVTWPLSGNTRAKITRTHKLMALGFRLQRSIGGRINLVRSALKQFVSRPEVIKLVRGKKIAVVGNARSLTGQAYGGLIDAADIVVRFNATPIVNTRSHGARTDWIATGVFITERLVRRRRASLILWMFKPRRLPTWMYRFPAVFLYPAARMDALGELIGSRPTSGLMVIDMLANSECAAVDLFGFDFFDSLSTSGDRKKEQVPHDFAKEQHFVSELLNSDPRFTHHR